MPEFKPDLASHAKEHKLKQRAGVEMQEAFGDSYSERVNPTTGKQEWRVRARGKAAMQKAYEIMRPAWREAKERGRALEAAIVPKATLNDGSVVPEWNAEDVCRKSGARERVRRKPTARYLATDKGLVRIG